MISPITVREIAGLVQGRLEGDATLTVDGAAGLEEAGERQISFFHNPKYAPLLKTTKAGALLLPELLNGHAVSGGKTLIRVANPQLAFARVLALFDRQRVPAQEPGVHPCALVDPSAQVAADASVGAFCALERGVRIGAGSVILAGCHVGENCRIGERTLIYPHAVLREDTQVGSRVIIHAGAVLGADGYGFVAQGERYHKIPQIGRVVIEDDVEIGANVTIDRGTTGETRVGEGTKIDNLVHIAHNVRIGKHCLIVAQVGISGSTRVGDRVTLAGQVGIIGHLTIGDGAVIAAQSGIMNDVDPGSVLFGSPARPHREAMKLQALFGKLPEIYESLKALSKKLSFPGT